MLEKRLEEAQIKEEKFLEEKAHNRQYTASFTSKVDQIKRDSEAFLKKKEKIGANQSIVSRKHSLPSLCTSANATKCKHFYSILQITWSKQRDSLSIWEERIEFF